MLYNTKKCYITTSFSIPSFSTASTQGTPWGPCGSQRLGSWGSTLVPPAQVSLRPNRPLWLWPRWHWPSMAWAFARIFVPPDRAQGAAGPKLGRRRRDAAWTVAVIIVLSLAGWQLQAKARSAYDVFTHYRSVQSRWPPGRSQWPQPTARERHGGRVAWVKQQLLSCHKPLLGKYTYTKHPQAHANLKVGKMNYSLGKTDPIWAKCLKSG